MIHPVLEGYFGLQFKRASISFEPIVSQVCRSLGFGGGSTKSWGYAALVAPGKGCIARWAG